jgi:hypothetical protein
MNEKGVFGRVGAHVRANVVAYAALFVALSGIAYAGVKPLLDQKGSVDSANVKNGSLAKGDLSGKLKQQLGVKTDGPANGTYAGTGTDEVSGQPVTFITSWAGGQPATAYMTSPEATCTSPTADGFEPLGHGQWTATGKSSTQELIATMQVVASSQILLSSALVTNTGKPPCKVATVSLQPEN